MPDQQTVQRFRTGFYSLEQTVASSYVARDLFTDEETELTPDEYFALSVCQETGTKEELAKNITLHKRVTLYVNGKRLLRRVPFMNNFLQYTTFKTGKLPQVKENEAFWRTILDDLEKKGLLITEDEAKEVLFTKAKEYKPRPKQDSKPEVIIGIPTKHRPDSLKETVKSIVANQQEYGETVPIVIADDSTDPEMKEKNIAVLKQITTETGHPIRYMDRENRADFAKKIAKEAGVDEEIVLFALTGTTDDNGAEALWATGGSARNTLLLESVGGYCIQIDDDIILDLKISPDKRSTLLLSNDLRSDRFIKNYNSIADTQSIGQKTKVNFVDKLTTHLGKHPLELIKNELNSLSEFQLKLFSTMNLFAPNSSIQSTHMGWYGDSCASFFHPASFDQTSLQHNLKNDKKYLELANSAVAVNTPLSQTLSQTSWFISANLACDVSTFVPFFSPVQREDDTVFGMLHYQFFSNAFTLYEPYMVFHNRERDKLQKHPQLFYLRTTEIITALIYQYSKKDDHKNNSDTPSKKMERFGAFLIEITSGDETEFLLKLKESIQHQLKLKQTNIIHIYFKNNIHHIDQYSKDIMEFARNLESVFKLIDSEHFLWDIPGSQEERLTRLQEWIRLYGKLNIAWPKIMHAAKETKQESIIFSMFINQVADNNY